MWPSRATVHDDTGAPKLHRYYLLGTGTTFGLFLHHFVGSDAPDTFHDHPWSWGLSLVLRGGYHEERCAGPDAPVTRRTLRPGCLNLLRPGVFHRVELPSRRDLDAPRRCRSAWTLFVHGPKVRRWGFLDRVTGAFEPWSPIDVGRR